MVFQKHKNSKLSLKLHNLTENKFISSIWKTSRVKAVSILVGSGGTPGVKFRHVQCIPVNSAPANLDFGGIQAY